MFLWEGCHFSSYLDSYVLQRRWAYKGIWIFVCWESLESYDHYRVLIDIESWGGSSSDISHTEWINQPTAVKKQLGLASLQNALTLCCGKEIIFTHRVMSEPEIERSTMQSIKNEDLSNVTIHHSTRVKKRDCKCHGMYTWSNLIISNIQIYEDNGFMYDQHKLNFQSTHIQLYNLGVWRDLVAWDLTRIDLSRENIMVCAKVVVVLVQSQSLVPNQFLGFQHPKPETGK